MNNILDRFTIIWAGDRIIALHKSDVAMFLHVAWSSIDAECFADAEWFTVRIHPPLRTGR